MFSLRRSIIITLASSLAVDAAPAVEVRAEAPATFKANPAIGPGGSKFSHLVWPIPVVSFLSFASSLNLDSVVECHGAETSDLKCRLLICCVLRYIHRQSPFPRL
jgi:hypothetical protein